jgi:predicted glycosyltransferase
MRDIEDDPETTRAEWAANGTAQLHRYVYDRILLYGQRDFFDPVEAYGMSEHVTAKLTATGYLRRAHAPRTPASVRGELNIGDESLILVTIGGGGDGYDIIKTYLDMLASFPDQTPYHSLIVTGPLMAQKKRTLLRRTVRNGSATMIEFTPDLIPPRARPHRATHPRRTTGGTGTGTRAPSGRTKPQAPGDHHRNRHGRTAA